MITTDDENDKNVLFHRYFVLIQRVKTNYYHFLIVEPEIMRGYQKY